MSILHRASGVFLFFCIPLLLYLMQLALQDEAGFERSRALLSTPLAWLLTLVIMWSLMHHLLAGIRYLLLDIHVGVVSPVYRYTAWGVMAGAPLVALVLTWVLMS